MSAAPESLPCRIFSGAEASRELATMGLRKSYFAKSITHGHERRERCAPTHPKAYPGQVMWAETLSHLRMECLGIAQNWEIGRNSGYETVFNGARQLAIAVVGGDANTGIRGFEDPMTARRRGPIAEIRVKRNYKGQAMLPGMPQDPTQLTEDDCSTWFFLINARENQLFSELSLPIIMGGRRRVSKWAKRILIEPIELVGAVTPIEPHEGPEDETIVHVGRK